MDNSQSKKIKTSDGKTVTIKIDRATCIRAGSCSVIATHTFGLDDDGLVKFIESNEFDKLEDIMSAAQSCPVFAIEIFDENNQKLWPVN